LPVKSLVGEALPDDLRYGQLKAPKVVGTLSVVVPKRLLVDIPKQMKRLDAYVSAVQAAFQKAPEILYSVRVNIPANVFDRMIDYGVVVIFGQSLVGLPFVAENRRTGFDVLADGVLKFFSLATIQMHRAHPAVTLDHAEYYLSLIHI